MSLRCFLLGLPALLCLFAPATPALAATTERVSISSAGEQGNWYSLSRSISADGRFVAFYSYASTLVPGDTDCGLALKNVSRLNVRV